VQGKVPTVHVIGPAIAHFLFSLDWWEPSVRLVANASGLRSAAMAYSLRLFVVAPPIPDGGGSTRAATPTRVPHLLSTDASPRNTLTFVAEFRSSSLLAHPHSTCPVPRAYSPRPQRRSNRIVPRPQLLGIRQMLSLCRAVPRCTVGAPTWRRKAMSVPKSRITHEDFDASGLTLS